ncbi:Beta-lactamase domain-containing protein [Desulfonema magnum]|uniref:Beta-lactamase domain-containing protein n=2 Tax=Desulfonema magnum TaxID=45655 RepID=A0A975BVS2_9BACT|nr:Beta-lactamase domain-containing protein [Desulfonema magnum]
MKMTITILAENTVSKSGLIGEHGFSVLIERGDEKYLFDTSPGASLPHNIKRLDKNLNGLNKIIISHGHYDHTGGLKWAIEQTGEIEVVAHPDMFCEHMALKNKFEFQNSNFKMPVDEVPRYVGCPHTRKELEGLGACFNFIDHTHEIAPGLWFITDTERDPELVPNDFRLVIPEGEYFAPDLIKDDATLLIEGEKSPILILGCAHSGILNILNYVREEMKISELTAVMGGTHLMYSETKDIPRIIDTLEGFSIDLIGVSHCTGMKAAVELAKHFGDRFEMASAGTVFNF